MQTTFWSTCITSRTKEASQKSDSNDCLLAWAGLQKVLKLFDMKERICLCEINPFSLQSFAKIGDFNGCY